MAASSSHRLISDDLLAVSVQIKREAGVSHAQVQEVIDRFACKERWEERTGGIGYPLIEDIPQDRRAEFMAALAELAPQSDQPRHAGNKRSLSAAHIWPSRIS